MKRKVPLDLSQAGVKAVWDPELDDVIIISVIPSAIRNVDAALNTLRGWIEYGRQAKDIQSVREGLVLPKEELSPKVMGEEDYTSISQADDPPGWYLEEGRSIAIVRRAGTAVDRWEEGMGGNKVIITPREISNDMQPEPTTMDVDDWDTAFEEHVSSMVDIYGGQSPDVSTMSGARPRRAIPDKGRAVREMKEFLAQNQALLNEKGICIKEWNNLSAKEIFEYKAYLREKLGIGIHINKRA